MEDEETPNTIIAQQIDIEWCKITSKNVCKNLNSTPF